MEGPIYKFSEIPGLMDMILEKGRNKYLTETKTQDDHRWIRYDKTILPVSLTPIYGKCKAIVVNPSNRVVGFAPPSCMLPDMFMAKYHDLERQPDIVVEEYIDSTMNPVFMNHMFDTIFKKSDKSAAAAVKPYIIITTDGTQQTVFLSNGDVVDPSVHAYIIEHLRLDKRFTYCFIPKEDGLVLVAVYEIEHKENPKDVWIHTISKGDKGKQNILKIDRFSNPITSYSQWIDTYASMNTPYHIPGIIMRNVKTGDRTKMMNPHYEVIRQLQAADPQRMYLYLCLRKEGKVGEYLQREKQKREEGQQLKHDFSMFRDQLHVYTETLYANYFDCFTKKKGGLQDFPEEYRFHMRQLHKKYLRELVKRKECIRRWTVIEYMNRLHPSQTMFWLYFTMRKRRVDGIQKDFDTRI